MKNILYALIMVTLLSSVSYASQFGGFDAGSINSQYMKDLRFHEAATRSKQKSAIVKKQEQASEANKKLDKISLQSIVFVGNNNVSSDKLTSINANKLNQPMSAENIADIRKNIMKYYQSIGYYSAIPMVSSIDESAGKLIIEIKEGEKNSITIDNSL